MKIDFIRHGQTNYNRDGKPMGRLDIPLNTKGIAQIEEKANILADKNYDIIISSPLSRAVESANIIAKKQNCKVVIDNRLIERDFGELSGTSYKQLDDCPHWNWIVGSKTNSLVKAENIDDMITRIKNLLSEILSNYKGKNVLLVAHDGVARAIYAVQDKAVQGTNLLVYKIYNSQLITFDINETVVE